MTNAEYRKGRGTDKPFNSTEEQSKAIWNDSIRKDKWRSTREPPAAGSTPAK